GRADHARGPRGRGLEGARARRDGRRRAPPHAPARGRPARDGHVSLGLRHRLVLRRVGRRGLLARGGGRLLGEGSGRPLPRPAPPRPVRVLDVPRELSVLAHLHDWLHLLLRWTHVLAGIMWIGDSFLFMWMDRTLAAPDPPREAVTGELFMVHGGGYYQLERRV